MIMSPPSVVMAILLLCMASFTNPFTSPGSSVAGRSTRIGIAVAPLSLSARHDTDERQQRQPNSRRRRRSSGSTFVKNTSFSQTWRMFGINVHPDDLDTKAPVDHISRPILDALCKRLKIDLPTSLDDDIELPPDLVKVNIIRRSLDARKKNGGPRYSYVLDVTIPAGSPIRLKPQPGRQELILKDDCDNRQPSAMEKKSISSANQTDSSVSIVKPSVIIVGAGPAGLFCALTLAKSGRIRTILLERGQPVESRGKDIGGLMHRSVLNTESNFCFGEGGAGTFSDGKLTTRIGRNSGAVRDVLETLVQYGAPKSILYDGAPHLGTDNLVRLMRNMRASLREMGAEIHFGAKVDQLLLDKGDNTRGVEVSYSPAVERSSGGKVVRSEHVQEKATLWGDALVLATGHSARDFYESLHGAGVQLEAKGFAAGFRVEHPQKLINEIQYGDEWGPCVVTGKSTTDRANQEHFESLGSEADHNGQLPVPSYRLATDKAFDGSRNRGAYSFCMCPGGQIVPASTNPDEMVVNGMSFSKRDSLWANSALVVTVSPDDPVLDPYREEHGVLAGIAFQRDMEQRAAVMGGGNLTVPVQRLTDFVAGCPSISAPPSSYRLGVKPSACHEIYPESMTAALKDAIINHFDQQLPGFLCEEGLLHAVETRTSSPVRISRDPLTLQAIEMSHIFPAGEGAGFAGGIVSAAVDGIAVGEAVLEDLVGDDLVKSRKAEFTSIGFSY